LRILQHGDKLIILKGKFLMLLDHKIIVSEAGQAPRQINGVNKTQWIPINLVITLQ
jgi:hypothetical protein